jgi:cystathionine gamma-synthase
VSFVNFTDFSAVARALVPAPRLVWIETPSNPLLRITDIAAVSRLAHDAGALVAVDNTFLSPAWQSPIDLGADLVAHSTTKYINGHSDVVGGAVVARDAALHEELAWWANCLGITGSPFDSYLTLRGLRTLHVRMRQHAENAEAIASRLDGHPAVRKVFYPGLPAHAGHALAARQQRAFGAIVSFELEGGEAAARRFVEGLRCFSLAESLGGVESLIAHPESMTHAGMDPVARIEAGITPGLLRLSVGIEAAADLIADLDAALARAQLPAAPRVVALDETEVLSRQAR